MEREQKQGIRLEKEKGPLFMRGSRQVGMTDGSTELGRGVTLLWGMRKRVDLKGEKHCPCFRGAHSSGDSHIYFDTNPCSYLSTSAIWDAGTGMTQSSWASLGVSKAYFVKDHEGTNIENINKTKVSYQICSPAAVHVPAVSPLP